MTTPNPSVLWNQSQSLTEEQKAQARNNIGAGAASLPAYSSVQSGYSLCVNSSGDGVEWASRIKGSLVEDDGQGSTITTNLKNLKINLNSTAKGIVRVTPEGGSIQIAGWLAPEFDSTDDIGKCLKVASDGLHLEWGTVSSTQADWNATSGSSAILNKPSLVYRGYGAGSDANLTGLKFDLDDPIGNVEVLLNGSNTASGYLVAGPYKILLDSGINGKGADKTPVYIDTDGTFKTCAPFPKSQKKINVTYTITSTDISNGYCTVDMFTVPYPEYQSDLSFVASVYDLSWLHGSTVNYLTSTDVSRIEVWGTRSDHTDIGYMYRNIDGSELSTSDAHHAASHPGDNYWNFQGCGSNNGSTMTYLTFKFFFASGTRFVAGDKIDYYGTFVQIK